MDSQRERFYQTLIFYNITDGNDTCLVLNFLDYTYEELNIKVVDWQSFDSYFLTKVLHNETPDVFEKSSSIKLPEIIVKPPKED